MKKGIPIILASDIAFGMFTIFLFVSLERRRRG